jgi:protein SCO1/2
VIDPRRYLPRSRAAYVSLAAALFLTLTLAGLVVWRDFDRRGLGEETVGAALVGGAFALTDQDGNARRDSDFRGRFMLVYFGFTHCPDACPLALSTMTAALAALGSDSDRVVPVFITVDPGRDTPARLKEYAAAFHPSLVMLTGDADALAAVAKAYRVYASRAEGTGEDYQVDHSSILYLMGPDGLFMTHFEGSASADEVAAAIRKRL